MRRSLAAQMGLAVLLWFFAAPFLHLHAADAEDRRHHEAGAHEEASHQHDAIVHFHMPNHHAAGEPAEISPPDEDETPLDSFAIAQKHPRVLAAPFLTVLRVQAPQPAPGLPEQIVVPHTPRAHDPPDLSATIPRAPPV